MARESGDPHPHTWNFHQLKLKRQPKISASSLQKIRVLQRQGSILLGRRKTLLLD